MRLFIGIALESEAADRLLRVRKRVEAAGNELRWSAPESWHVTLQFLGQVAEERAACVAEKLRTVRAERVPVRMEGVGFFERAGVFWSGVMPTPQLLALQQFVTAAMRNCGFEPEKRAYNPHITLARAKGRGGARALEPLKKAVEKAKAEVRAEFVAEEFVLYESHPGPEGSRYEVKERFRLG